MSENGGEIVYTSKLTGDRGISPVVEINYIEEINREHELFRGTVAGGLKHAIRCGELLIEQKEKVFPSEWLLWVRGNCSFTPRMAQNYMRIARKAKRVSFLDSASSIRGAISIFSEPKLKKELPERKEKEPAFSWFREPVYIAMLGGVQAIKRLIPELQETNREKTVALYILRMLEKTLSAILKQLRKYLRDKHGDTFEEWKIE